MNESYETQLLYASNLLNSYLAVKDYFYTFTLAVEALCPDMLRVAPGSTGREVFADLIRSDQWFWEEECLSGDGSGLIRCENLIVTMDSQGFVDLAVYKNSAEAEEAFAQAKYLIEDEV